MVFAIKGNIISAPKFGEIEIFENSYIVIEDGLIKGIFNILPSEYKKIAIKDYGDNLIFQSFSDMHLHAPQYPMLGIGLDKQLLDWLNTYTFPNEARFNDPLYARKVYRRLAKELVENGTTRVAMFSSLHYKSTLILMDELEKAGITGYVGKVNMDRNSVPNLNEKTKDSIKNTRKWIEASSKFTFIKPIITPRFTPSCTDELMEELGKIAKEYNLPIQSHLSENLGEKAWVKELHPECEEYYQTYAKFGLWDYKTLMAHCVHCSEQELNAIKEAGVYVVHCPSSNENLISGVAPIRKMIDNNIKVVLGSDIAGGDKISMFDNIVEAIKVSKIYDIMDNYQTPFLSVEEAFYLATSAANEFFNELPGFAIGNEFHAIVLDDSKLMNTKNLSIKERFERAMYVRAPKAIKAVYSAGRRIYYKI